MDLTKLNGFIKHATGSSNPFIQQQGRMTQHAMLAAQEDEQIAVPAVTGNPATRNKQPAIEDKLLQDAMPEIYNPDPNDNSSFGKVAPVDTANPISKQCSSTYVKTLATGELPSRSQEKKSAAHPLASFILNGKAKKKGKTLLDVMSKKYVKYNNNR